VKGAVKMDIDNLVSVWPEWKIVEQIGEGSYGKVYKAAREEHGISSYSAIKVMSIPQNESETETLRLEGLDETATRTYFEEIVKDFVSEIRLMESLKGTQNIVVIEDFKVVEKKDKIGWNIYIRMELLKSFNEYACNKKLTESEIVKLGTDICGALELCAQRGIIHRDIKPENIFISDFGCFKLGDFGIARQIEKTASALSRKGTLNYMAPEVNNGSRYDSRADIYSLGIVLYKLLNNNRIPFVDPYKQLVQYKDRINAVEKRMNGEPLPPPAQASDGLSEVILKACAFKPGDRYQNVTEFKNAMQSVINNGAQKKSGKSRLNYLLIALIAAFLAGGILFSVYAANKFSRRKEETANETEKYTTESKLTYGAPHFNSIIASSEFGQQGEDTYSPEQAMDGNPKTAWVEGVQGNGTGEWIQVSSNETQKVSALKMMIGFNKTEDLYYRNNRPKEILIVFDDGSAISEKLSDEHYYGYQYIYFKEPVFTKSVRIEILSIYPGSEYHSTCISEIEFN